MPDAYNHTAFKRRAIIFAILTVIFFSSVFIFSPLGSFFIWISIGGTLYCAFYSIYNFVLSSKANPHTSHRVKKETEQERNIKEHIRFHIPILISLFLAALLLVIVYWLFFT